ncbi:putative galacturonosyltransferase 11 [Sesamum angolense]|uniref:Hexosyltransferase n=1 Tax=Sesamum angolense TaxID=2727404 RepID=A0AAE2BYM4_9LAMI|nr:putative galacturonosyltransferase 11 [Sesamum angolense]
MQAWFLSNDFKGATIEVKNIEEFSWLNASYSPVVKQLQDTDSRRFYFEGFDTLFSLDLHGNVNGAVETCLEAFHRYYKYLNFSNPLISTKVDPQACGWAFGMNVFDLIAWRKANVTTRYHYWQEKNTDKSLWKLGTLPPGLLAFYGLTEPLDRRWHVLGLGYDLNIDNRLIETAAVIHFNGNMKPWLKLSIGRYRPLWEQYVNQTHRYLQDCTTS